MKISLPGEESRPCLCAACEWGAALEGLFTKKGEPCLTMAGDVCKIRLMAFPNQKEESICRLDG